MNKIIGNVPALKTRGGQTVSVKRQIVNILDSALDTVSLVTPLISALLAQRQPETV